MKLQRYDIKDNGDYYENLGGQWVDADEAVAALEAAEAENERLRREQAGLLNPLAKLLVTAEAENERLRARVAELERYHAGGRFNVDAMDGGTNWETFLPATKDEGQ